MVEHWSCCVQQLKRRVKGINPRMQQKNKFKLCSDDWALSFVILCLAEGHGYILPWRIMLFIFRTHLLSSLSELFQIWIRSLFFFLNMWPSVFHFQVCTSLILQLLCKTVNKVMNYPTRIRLPYFPWATSRHVRLLLRLFFISCTCELWPLERLRMYCIPECTLHDN